MQKEMNNAIKLPRYILLGFMVLISIGEIYYISKFSSYKYQNDLLSLSLFSLLPLVIAYILSFYYPVMAGSILILGFVNVFFIQWLSETVHLEFYDYNTLALFIMYLAISTPVILGIWMIINFYKTNQKLMN